MKALQLFSKLKVLLCTAAVATPTILQPGFSGFPAKERAAAVSSPVVSAESVRGGPRVEGDLFHTIEQVPVYGHIKVFSPTGSEIDLVLVVKPSKGSVSLDGNSFEYTPYPGAQGDDSFTVAGTDRAGNRSNEAVIAISVDSAAGMPYFCDMDRHPYEYSAIRLADAGIVSGESVGSRQFFYPDRVVRRGEFVVQLLSARGWDGDLPVCINTGLENDGTIPLWMKPYIKRAMDRGIVSESAFDVQSVPTRAEAVVLTDRAARIDDVLKYNLTLYDRPSIPDWSMQSYINLAAYRMLDLYDGRARPDAELNRGYAASLLWQLHKLEKQD